MKLQHPVTGFVRDVTDERRIQVLKQRGYEQVDDDTPIGVTPGPLQRDDNGDQARAEGPPARSASKADWVAYAEAQGAENADELTKDELVERFGKG